MIFMCQYEIDRDKQADTQAFFASMTDEQIANECPEGVTKIGRWHDVPNGCGVMIVETNDQNAYEQNSDQDDRTRFRQS